MAPNANNKTPLRNPFIECAAVKFRRPPPLQLRRRRRPRRKGRARACARISGGQSGDFRSAAGTPPRRSDGRAGEQAAGRSKGRICLRARARPQRRAPRLRTGGSRTSTQRAAAALGSTATAAAAAAAQQSPPAPARPTGRGASAPSERANERMSWPAPNERRSTHPQTSRGSPMGAH